MARLTIILFGIIFSVSARSNFISSFNEIDKDPLLIKADSLYLVREFDSTIYYCKILMSKLNPENQLESYLYASNLLGATYTKIRRFDLAYEVLNWALTTGSKRLAEDHPLVGDSHYQLGVYYDLNGQPDKSIEHHQIALETRIKNNGKSHLKVAESLNGFAEVYMYTLKRYRKADHYMQQTANILEKLLKKDDFQLYVTYFNLAEINRHIGDTERALSYGFKALEIVKAKQQYQAYLHKCYSLIGDAYYNKLDFENTISFSKKGIEQLILTEGPDHFDLITKYKNLGVCYSQFGQYSRAHSYFRRATNLMIQGDHHDAELKGEILQFQGIAYKKMNNLDSAIWYLKTCLYTRSKFHDSQHSRISETYRQLGNAFHHFGYLDSAIVYLQQSLISAIPGFDDEDYQQNPSINIIGERYDLFQTFGSKGTVLLEQYLAHPDKIRLLKTSLECFQIADQLMELNRNSYQREGSKLFFADHYQEIYESALRACYLLFKETGKQTYLADALNFMEKNKAFLLLETLTRAEIYNQVGLPDSLKELERTLDSELARYKSQVESNALRSEVNDQQDSIQSLIFNISQQQAQLSALIARQYPNYYQTKHQKLATLPEIQEFIKKSNAILIEYFWGAANLYIIGISSNKILFEEISKIDSLQSKINNYFIELSEGPVWNRQEQQFNRFLKNGHLVYDKLIAPIIRNLEWKEKLIIIRDGPLQIIPFESLPVNADIKSGNDYGKIEYLIQRHNISYAYSAQLLINEQSRANQSTSNKILALGFSSNDDLETANGTFSELPGSAFELENIRRLFSGIYLSGVKATEHQFKSQAGDFDILHLAVHGKADPQMQFRSSLYFKNSADSVDDGELHIYELYDLSLKAKLAVLSACETGVGKFFKGEGVFSMARGFAYAGCPSIVMSLWQITDNSNSLIMKDFYGRLKKGAPIDQALRSAKLGHLANAGKLSSHPYYWAGYIPVGNMDPITVRSKGRFIWAVLVLLVVLGFWRLRKKSFFFIKRAIS